MTSHLKEKRAEIFAAVDKKNVLAALARHAALVDEALREIADRVAGGAKKMPCIVATGGYGRREMGPLSDVDVLFVSETALSPAAQTLIETVQKECWALGLKPSASVRTLQECAEAMEGDVQFLTSLLARRCVWGDKKTYAQFDALFTGHVKEKSKSAFIEAKLAERDARHKKMGDARYQLQPNVKEGKGALRDIQTLFWLCDFLGLGMGEILTAQEARTLDDAYAFFWAVRCHLQLLGASDRLSFELQPEVAARMGYTDAEPNRRAEKFMKDYFLMTNETGHLTRALCTALESGALKGARKTTMKEEVEGFTVKRSRLTAGNFADDPAEILRIFRVSQTTGLDIHPDALRHIRGAKGALAKNKTAMATFLDILLDPRNAEQTLRRMNEAGILGALIPPFEGIVAHMQYDMYHTFTADEHTLRAVGTLHDIENGKLDEAAPLAAELFGKTHSRRALYAAMFLHDIAKGAGGKHSEKGASAAKNVCPLLGLTPEETETAAWLVENHLLMTMTAYKRDLGDPKTLADFTAAVQSPERLKLLTILTTADIIAVGPGRWNNWKSGLLAALYHKAAEALAGAAPDADGYAQFAAAQRKVRRLIGEKTKTLNALIDYAPPYFWLSFTPETIASFIGAMHGREEKVRVTPVTEEDYTEVFVHAHDRKGLFATLAGALASAGASIVEARIFTLGNAKALDVFHVQNLNGHVYENTEFLKKTLKAALSGALDLKEEIAARQKNMPAKSRLFSAEPRVIIDNSASASSTVIEVNGMDRPGFLFDVTSAISALGLQISAAKIATFGTRAVDVFYVKDGFGLKILHEKKLQDIENTLKKAIYKNCGL